MSRACTARIMTQEKHKFSYSHILYNTIFRDMKCGLDGAAGDKINGDAPAEDFLELMLGHELAEVGDKQGGAGGVVYPNPRLR